jgi:enoyl-CoA hydratase/carnithine racemase
MDTQETVLYSLESGIARITLNRPERKNAIDDLTWTALLRILAEVRMHPDVRVVILTGAGRDFCSGADVAKSAHQEHPIPRLRRIGDVAQAIFELPMPVIARVDGVAAGAGCNMALACDFVLASNRARFTEIFSKRGLSIDFGGSWLLPRIVGLQQAKRLALLAEMVSAAEALEMGLVTEVAAEDCLDELVEDYASRLAALPPIALMQTKRLLNEGVDSTLRDAIANESAAQAVNFATEDAPAAFRAFVDKADAPVYTGRWAVR